MPIVELGSLSATQQEAARQQLLSVSHASGMGVVVGAYASRHDGTDRAVLELQFKPQSALSHLPPQLQCTDALASGWVLHGVQVTVPLEGEGQAGATAVKRLRVRFGPALRPPGCCVVKVGKLSPGLAKPGVVEVLLRSAGYGPDVQVVAEFLAASKENPDIGRSDQLLAYVKYPLEDPALRSLPSSFEVGGQPASIKVDVGNLQQVSLPPLPPRPTPVFVPPGPPGPPSAIMSEGSEGSPRGASRPRTAPAASGLVPGAVGAGGHPPADAPGEDGGVGQMEGVEGAAAAAPAPAAVRGPAPEADPHQQRVQRSYDAWRGTVVGTGWAGEVRAHLAAMGRATSSDVVEDNLSTMYKLWREVYDHEPMPATLAAVPAEVRAWLWGQRGAPEQPVAGASGALPTFEVWADSPYGGGWVGALTQLLEDACDGAELEAALRQFYAAHKQRPEVQGGGYHPPATNAHVPDWAVSWLRAERIMAAGYTSASSGGSAGEGRLQRRSRSPPARGRSGGPQPTPRRSARAHRPGLRPCEVPATFSPTPCASSRRGRRK